MTLADTMQDRTQDEAAARQRFTEMFTRDGFIQATVILAIAIALIGVFTNDEIQNFGGAFHEFYANISSELLSILITVLIIERFNARRQDKQELTRLKALLGSNETVVTKIAVAELRARGWLQDGSLQGADLQKANLAGIYMREANLSGANLSFVDSRDVQFGHANLSGAKLIAANLTGANLMKANLESTRLINANLSRANLIAVNLSGAMLASANLSGTVLGGANLSGAMLGGANLSGASLRRANLSSADLWLSNLSNADLWLSNLSNADLGYAILPDGTKWTPETDMTRFTDPEHPDFWQPDKKS